MQCYDLLMFKQIHEANVGAIAFTFKQTSSKQGDLILAVCKNQKFDLGGEKHKIGSSQLILQNLSKQL